jgi:acyl-homoserine lactone acylase PvdQ
MATIHRDDLSAPAQLFQAALADAEPSSAAARAVRDIVLGWDARMSPGSSGAACYSRLRWALARIVWIVAGGASGDPSSPHYADQHQAWSRCELIPMRYDWDTIAAASPQLTLQPHDSPSSGSG